MRGRRDLLVCGALVAVVVAFVLTSCSSDSDSEPAATTTASPTSIENTTTSTTESVDTTPSTVTSTIGPPQSTSTEALPTSTSEATTVAPPVDPETEVRATLDRTFSDFSDCLTSLPECDPSVLEATRAGELLDGNVERINEWNAAGYTVIDRDQYRYVIEAVEIGGDGSTAAAQVCLADGSKLVLPGGADDGTDLVIDDEFVSGRETWLLEVSADGMWRAFAAPAVGVTEESDICPAA